MKCKFFLSFILILTLFSSFASASSDNGKVLYTENKGLYIASLTSSGIGGSKRICDLKYSLQYPASCLWCNFTLSPDGKKIIFREEQDTVGCALPGDLLIMSIDGSDLKRLTYDEKGRTTFHWLSDSKRVLYCGESIRLGDNLGGAVSLVDIETGEKEELIEKGAYPSISPDEKKIFYAGPMYWQGNEALAKIYCMDLERKDNRFFSEIKTDQCYPQSWSKDSLKVLSGNMIINVGSGEYMRFTEERVHSVEWFRDNKHFAFVVFGEYNNIMVTDIDLSEYKQLTKSGDVIDILAITGEKIYYTRRLPDYSRAVWSIDLDGSNPTRLLSVAGSLPEIHIWFPGK